MMRVHQTGRIRPRWGAASLFETTEGGAESCRVCCKPIADGEQRIGRHWHVGSSHVECRYWKLSDLDTSVQELLTRTLRDGLEFSVTDRRVSDALLNANLRERNGTWLPKGLLMLERAREVLAAVPDLRRAT